MKKIYFAIASLALLFIGCQDDETLRSMTEEVSSFNQITVTPDMLADTRAHLDNDIHVVWDENDTIGVYSDTDGVVPFVYSSGNTFTAAKPVKGTQFYAFYPYSYYPLNNDTIKVDKDTLVTSLPNLNYTLSGTNIVISNKFPMVGKSTNNQFAIKQVMGMMHFTVKDMVNVLYVTLSSNNNELMNGPSKIDMSADNPVLKLYIPEDQYAWSGNAYYTAYVGKTMAEGEVADIYIPIPVGTYANGFTLTINGTDKNDEAIKMTKRTDKEVVVARASMNSYTEVAFDDDAALENINEAMANAYASFYMGVESIWSSGASFLNNIVFGDTTGGDANKGSVSADQPDWEEISNYSITPYNPYIGTKWNAIYNAVQRANRVLNLVDNAKKGVLENSEQMIGQAKFIKAVWMFEGIRMFGAAIPYVSLEDYQANHDNPQVTNVDQSGNYIYIWDRVEQDLRDAIAYLPGSWDAGNKGRATKWMAMAMLAKLYMYWSSPYNGTNATALHLAQAKSILEDIVNSGKYSLVNKYSDLFNPYMPGETSESIFDIEVPFGYYTKLVAFGGWGFYQPTHEFVNSFIVDSNGLPANDYTTLAPLSTYADYNISTDLNTAVDPRLDFTAGRVQVPYWDKGMPEIYWIRSISASGPYMNKKFQSRIATYFYIPIASEVKHYSVIRYADILLMLAEVAIRNGDLASALYLINQVRSRAANDFVTYSGSGYTMDDKVNNTIIPDAAGNYRIGLYTSFGSTEEAWNALRREMRAEFGMEGHRWFDIARWGIPATVINDFRAYEKQYFPWKYENEYQAKWVTFPIPTAAIESSEGRIVQNVNWK